MTPSPRWLTILLCAALSGCLDDVGLDDDDTTNPDDDEGETDVGGVDGLEATLTHDFGTITLAPFEEIENCVQWTLDNDAPLYVQEVTLSNFGYFHHSNWFVVPEDLYPGEDGFFDCSSRGFTELAAAGAGTVLFAQSTQSFEEHQRTVDGAVIKIPARHKVVAGTHLLNVGPGEVESQLFMSLSLIHPKLVELVLTPFRLSYLDLDIPANAESRFTGQCDGFGARYEAATGGPMDMVLHYVLPHYHYLGNYFSLEFIGEGFDGPVYEHDGFNGGANGLTFDPPLDLSTVDGLRYTCGYDNWRDVNVGWGVGDQEMCVMLGLAESSVMMDITVTGGTQAVGQSEDGVLEFEAPCGMLVIAKNPAQGMPSYTELSGDLYVPSSGDPEIPPVPECVDHDPSVAPTLEPSLSNVAGVVFQQSCTFNACHGSSAQAAGLDLQAPDLHAELFDHEIIGNVGATLVEPGDPESSWLYRILADCEPQGGSGSHMPLNAPVLLDDTSIALVREWIAAGALDD
ncbi:hypothetical protein G6O69_29785 [Pseudenhygromyxa sp. WMMC2535]|uniref:hypothetical protein n=1 Tax=Pseudenhygromyxa sp. WMMC2535 TaxID=2712867 RepID=UPI001557D7BA|nr:hypothetical protein [Pseudenhygromyxa sp. WMMC2535]NVB42053.1 hypothetical protein [Pseudenhygromyxa sp. WMMC2535]